MNCPKCNYVNNAEAKFCNQCATPLIQEPVQSVTPIPVTVKVLPKEDWAYKAGRQWAKMDKVGKVSVAGVLGALAISFVLSLTGGFGSSQSDSSQAAKSYYDNHSAPTSPSSNAYPTVPAKPAGLSAKSHLEMAKLILDGNITPNNITAATEHLTLISDKEPEYKEAKELLGKIKSGKIRPMSDFEAENQDAISALRNVDNSLTYAQIKKNPNRYAGEAWAFTGKILEIQEPGNGTVARIGVGAYGLEAIYVEAPFTTEFVDKNTVFVIGTIKGTKSYTSQAGWEITIPYVVADAIVKPSDSGKLKAAASKQ